MALLWIDGFDAYGGDGVAVDTIISESGYTLNGTSGQPASPACLTSANTRDGVGFSLNVNSWHNGYSGGIQRSFGLSDGVVAGFAVQIVGESAFTAICQFGYNNLVGGEFDSLRLFYNNEAGLTCTDGGSISEGEEQTTIPPWVAGNLIAASAPNVLFPGVWQYIEVLYSPNSSGGSLQIKIDGAVVINVTGNVMTAGNPAAVNYLSFTNTAPNNVTLIDDLYICDQTGPVPFNTYLGDVVVHAAFPINDASPNQWTQAGGGVGHFTAIDDNPGPDDDASYLFSNTAGQQELFDISTFPPDIIDVLAVGVNIRARKDTAGYAFYMANLVVASTEGDIGPIVASQAYETSQSIYELAPGGGSWTTSAAQNCKIGFSIPT